MGRHGGRSDEKNSDLGYSSDEQHPSGSDRGARWWEDSPARAVRPLRSAEPWWDDAPVPPPVVVASADGRTPAVTFAPGADPFSEGGVFAPTGARSGEPLVVVHPAPDAAVLRPARRRPLAADTGALRLPDEGAGTGSLVRPYVPALDEAGGAAPQPAPPSTSEAQAAPAPRRGARRTRSSLDLVIEASGPVVPLPPRAVGEWSAPWATEREPSSDGSRSLFDPRPVDPSVTWAAPREQALPSRKALRAQERAGTPRPGPGRGGTGDVATSVAGSPLVGTALAGDLGSRSGSRRLAKSGVLAVTALGVVAASAPNAFSALGWHLPSRTAPVESQAAIVGLAGVGPVPDVSLSGQLTRSDDLDLSLGKLDAQRRIADSRAAAAQAAAAHAAATRAGAVAAGAGRTLVDVARDQVRAEAARKAAIADRASRNVVRDPRAYARVLLSQRGWGDGQFSCLNSLWNRESGWDQNAYNPSSGAYGIPQALPGSKMATIAPDWRTNPATQIRWGLNYIAERYGTPCGAWAHSEATGWY